MPELAPLRPVVTCALSTNSIEDTHRNAWNRALREWRCQYLLREASGSIGPMARAEEEHEMLKHRERFAPGQPRNAALEAGWQKLTAAEEEHNEINRLMDKAAECLIVTPAPDLDAVEFKIKLAEAFEIWAVGEIDVFDVIQRDIERLG